MLQRQAFEIKQLWWHEWWRQARERSDEWRAANPPPDIKTLDTNAPLPDGTQLKIDWNKLKNRG